MTEKLSTFQQVDIDAALEAFNGDRYKMILGAAVLARQIETKRNIADRASPGTYANKPTVAALKEIAAGDVQV
jgi:DNA-directed RNA polymerase omega subunit